MDLPSVLFIGLTAAAIGGRGLHRRVFLCCNADCRVNLQGKYKEEGGRREAAGVSGEC